MPLWITTAQSYLSGLCKGLRKREGIRIFYYHGVIERKADPLLERNFNLLSDFQSHIRFLRRFRILGLAELADALSNNTGRFGAAAIITFDDGYANNLLAGEIMNAARLPWSIFISTGAVGRDNSTWPLELALLLLHGQAGQVEALDRIWSLKSRDAREAAFQAIRVRLKAMPQPLRRELLDWVRQQFPEREIQRLLKEFPSLQMLSWEEVKHLANGGAEIGSHGVDHEIHHPNQPETTRSFELTESKAELERRLNRPCLFFAFPDGGFTRHSADEVRAAGYKLSFTTQPDTVKHGASPFLLPRFYPAGSLRHFTHEFFWETPPIQ